MGLAGEPLEVIVSALVQLFVISTTSPGRAAGHDELAASGHTVALTPFAKNKANANTQKCFNKPPTWHLRES